MPDVVVVGAGPVGMTAAALLAARGVPVAVLEASDQTSAEPKAISIDDESLRTFADAGIIDPIMQIVSPGTGTKYFDRHGNELFHARGEGGFRVGHPFKNPFAQPDLERVLASELDTNPHVDLRFGARVAGLEESDGQVAVRIAGATAIDTVMTRFVIGADGGRSTVRQSLGIAMHGRTYQTPWLVVDTLNDPHRQMYGMHLGTPERPTVIVAGKGGRCRYEFLLHQGEGNADERPDHALIAKLLSPYREIEPEEVERAVVYTFNGLIAESWRRGNVFLSGDAAHMMPPFAGQGLNSGIRDVANLCWKLADVLDGRLSVSVLDTYEPERRPHAQASVRLSERLGRTVMTTSARLAEARDRLIADALATDEGRTFLERMRYRPSLHVTDGLVAPTTETADVVGRLVRQPRAFDMGTSAVRYLDAVTGYRWLLLGVGVGGDAWRETHALVSALDAARVHVCLADELPDSVQEGIHVLVDVDGTIEEEFSAHRGTFLLVRPDHVVAASWQQGRHADAAGAVMTWTATAQ